MKFIFYDEVFTPNNYQKLLLCILTICESTRHHIMILNEDGAEYQKFLCHYVGNAADLIRGRIKNDPREFILDQSIIYKVNNEQTCFDSHVINVEDLYLNLKKKFNLYLENSINDYLFILFYCTKKQKDFFKNCLDTHEFQVPNGGGIGTLKNMIEHHTFDKDCSFVIFDSDNLPLQPHYVNLNTKLMEDAVIQKQAKFHKLHRRNIENYIPLAALKDLHKQNQLVLDKIQVLENLYTRVIDFKINFSVKEGLNKDLKASNSVPNYIDISSTLSSDELRELNTGFGKDIAETVFSLDLPEALKKEDIDAWREVNGIITRIQNLM